MLNEAKGCYSVGLQSFVIRDAEKKSKQDKTKKKQLKPCSQK